MARSRTLDSVLLEPEVFSLTDEAYARLLDRLVFLDIQPGAALNDLDVSAELGIGRTPIRSAFRRLENEGLITTYPRRGTFASAMDVKDLTALNDLRRVLEPHAARRAADVCSAANREHLSALQEEINAGVSGSNRELLAYELGIHRAIYTAAENQYLAATLRTLNHLAGRIWALVVAQLPDLTRSLADHIDLIGAIVAGEPDRAAQLALEHVDSFEEEVRAAL